MDGGGGASSSSANEVHAPGAYRSLCVELKLHHLVVNAIDKVMAGEVMQSEQGHQACFFQREANPHPFSSSLPILP